MTQEVFDVAARLSQLFGVGDGRVIFRSVAAELKEKHRRVLDQGGGRKVVALWRTVEQLISSYRTYHGSLHARRGQSEGADKRGSATKSELVDLGRRFASIGFVTFLIAVADIMSKRVVPLACESQSCATAAWEMDRACHETVDQVRQDCRRLCRLRLWIFLGTMLQCYVVRRDMVRFFFAALSPCLARTSSHLYPLLFTREFRRCQLTVPVLHDDTKQYVLAPHCQCPSMRARPGPGVSRRMVVRLPRHRPAIRLGDEGVVHDAPLLSVLVSVPEWVGASVYDKASWQNAPKLPRFVTVAREERCPPALQGISRFSHQHCMVPAHLPAAALEMVSALSAAESFCSQLAYNFEAYLVGSVGVQASLRSLLSHARDCWNWKELVKRPPREHEYLSFFALWEELKPALLHTEWPSAEPDFQWLPRQWPGKRGAGGLFEQYKTLMQRVRSRKGQWVSRATVLVEPVWSSSCLECSLGLLPLLRRNSPVKACIFHVIASFAGHRAGASVFAAKPFAVRVADLAAVGYGRTMKRARTLRSQQVFTGRIGSFASLAKFRPLGRLVRVQNYQDSVDEQALASAFISDRSLVFPDSGGRHCWHAVRIYLRCRLVRGPESSCERWGSLLHDLWDSISGWQPHRMVSRLLLREAGLSGGSDSEALVQEIAQALMSVQKKNPFPAGRKFRAHEVGSEEDLAARRALRENVIDKHLWKAEACPQHLFPASREALSKAQSLGRGAALGPLPVHAEDVRTTKKSRTVSVVRAALTEWWESEEGKAWQSRREDLLGIGAASWDQ